MKSELPENNGICSICFKEVRLVLDHDHGTGLVRGWVCRQCNAALAIFDEDPGAMGRMARYIAQPPLNDLNLSYRRSKYLRHPEPKQRTRDRARQWYAANKEKAREYQIANHQHTMELQQQRRLKQKEFQNV